MIFETLCDTIRKEFDYGFVHDGKKYKLSNGKNVNKMQELYKTMSPEIVEKYKIGICWDITNYQYYKFKQSLNKLLIPQLYFFYIKDKINFHTHTIFTLRNKETNKITWYECSYYSHFGNYEFDNEKEIFEKMKSFEKECQCIMMYKFNYPGRFNMSPDQFIDYCVNNECIYSYTKIEK